MTLKGQVLTVLFVAVALFATAATVGAQGTGVVKYKAEVYCNFKFDRTVEIVFDPVAGNQKATVFYGPAKISSTPPSPPSGEVVEMEKSGDKWVFKRDNATRCTTISKDEGGKLLIGWPTGGHFAEGELKPFQQVQAQVK